MNYLETEYYKIIVSNNKFKDQFDIRYDQTQLTVQRTDKNTGWGQLLELSLWDKTRAKEEMIYIGSSEKNSKTILWEYIFIPTTFHYEDEKIKIFPVSMLYNDLFQIKYDQQTKQIEIIRIDADTGWGQELELLYIEKKTKREKRIYIGKSDQKQIRKIIEIEKIQYIPIYNRYESDQYLIELYQSTYKDVFWIEFYEENHTLYIQRKDLPEGWGQPLQLQFWKKDENRFFIIYVGSSIKNELYQKIDPIDRKCYISLSTIPSRIVLPIFMENIKDLIKNQGSMIEHIFISIPKKYKRFTETIPYGIIEQLQRLPKIILIELEEDLGPASKYMGPLMKYYSTIENNLLIVIDDDRMYNKNLTKHFKIAYHSFPEIQFSSGLWTDYFEKNYKYMDENSLEIILYHEKKNHSLIHKGVGGFYGFCIKINSNLHAFVEYNQKILTIIPKSFFHDEGIILGYLKYKQETIMYLKHKGCNFIKEELIDALCTSNYVNREKIEKEIFYTIQLQKLL